MQKNGKTRPVQYLCSKIWSQPASQAQSKSGEGREGRRLCVYDLSPMGADDDPAPRSEATRDRPEKSPTQARPRLSQMMSKHRLSVCNMAANGETGSKSFLRRMTTMGSSSFLNALTSEAQQKAFEKQRRSRSIALRLAEFDTNYDALFARRERENAARSLNVETLQRGVNTVNNMTHRRNRFLIKPDGNFMQALDVSTMLALLFTAVVSPYEIAFLSDSNSISLMVANYMVMIVFAIGLVCSFFVPYREPLWKGGALVRDRKKIAIRYIQTWFFFDLISTLPFDEILSQQVDDVSDSQAASLRALRGARLVRLIRLFRLVKLGRLLRAQRVIARITAKLEKNSEIFNISFTIRTAAFWMAVVLMVIHWFCCSWGILALIQESQRTEELVNSLSDDCRAQGLALAESANYHVGACLAECEIDKLAELLGVRKAYVTNEEPWICRRITEGQFTGESPSKMYIHLLHGEGLLKNPGGKTARVEENVLFFILSYLMLVLRTLFIGTISGAFTNAKPLLKAWQARMDHLNLFLKEMNAPSDLRTRTRQYLRNTQNLELKRSFSGLYAKFSNQLAGEMMSHMSASVVRGVYFFVGCEADFIRDLAAKMFYEAFDRGEKVVHEQPTLLMIVQGTLVRGGNPFGVGQCIGEDVLLQSDELRDRRLKVALTFLEVCCLTKQNIESTAVLYPKAARRLRFEAFKIAVYRSTQLLANYVSGLPEEEAIPEGQDMNKRKQTIVGDALANLGEDVSEERKEVHTFMHAINGGTKLRGLAHEQANSEDPNMANHAQEAVALAEDTPRAKRVVIDEDGVMVDDQVKVPKGEARLASGHSNGAGHDRLAEELRSEIAEMREENRTAMAGLKANMATLMTHLKGTPGRHRPKQRLSQGSLAATTTTTTTTGANPMPRALGREPNGVAGPPAAALPTTTNATPSTCGAAARATGLRQGAQAGAPNAVTAALEARVLSAAVDASLEA